MLKLTLSIEADTWAALESTLLMLTANDIRQRRLAGKGFTMHSDFSFSVIGEEERDEEEKSEAQHS